MEHLRKQHTLVEYVAGGKKKINQQSSVWFEGKGSSIMGLDNRSEASLLH